jgi:hypothetical protein
MEAIVDYRKDEAVAVSKTDKYLQPQDNRGGKTTVGDGNY